MADKTASKRRRTHHLDHLRPRSSRRLLAGLFTATVLLAGVTAILLAVKGESRFADLSLLLGVIGVTAAVGGFYAAGPAVLAAALVADYYFTEPVYQINPLIFDYALFVAAGAVISVTVTLAARYVGETRAAVRGDVVDAVDRALRATVPARHWAAVYTTHDQEEYTIWAPGQAPGLAAQQLADGVHGLSCPSCDRCRLDVAA